MPWFLVEGGRRNDILMYSTSGRDVISLNPLDVPNVMVRSLHVQCHCIDAGCKDPEWTNKSRVEFWELINLSAVNFWSRVVPSLLRSISNP